MSNWAVFQDGNLSYVITAIRRTQVDSNKTPQLVSSKPTKWNMPIVTQTPRSTGRQVRGPTPEGREAGTVTAHCWLVHLGWWLQQIVSVWQLSTSPTWGMLGRGQSWVGGASVVAGETVGGEYLQLGSPLWNPVATVSWNKLTCLRLPGLVDVGRGMS